MYLLGPRRGTVREVRIHIFSGAAREAHEGGRYMLLLDNKAYRVAAAFVRLCGSERKCKRGRPINDVKTYFPTV
jgi:hypothetical protein